jgi:hypothetical protein
MRGGMAAVSRHGPWSGPSVTNGNGNPVTSCNGMQGTSLRGRNRARAAPLSPQVPRRSCPGPVGLQRVQAAAS